jgi:hypothetical protein
VAVARRVLPEVLDELPPDDPRARRSRCDLRRIHVAMGTAGIVHRELASLHGAETHRRRGTPRPVRLLELGAGDGTLLLRVARRLAPSWRDVDLTLVDRVNLLDAHTRDAYAKLGWRVRVLTTCALDWAARLDDERYDACVTSLFLHHFPPAALGTLLAAAASRCDALIAVEPRRSIAAMVGSRLVVALGANAVTRADAVTSVEAGFTGRELTRAWPRADAEWRLRERRAGPFSHCFVAVRRTSRLDATGDPTRDPYGASDGR